MAEEQSTIHLQTKGTKSNAGKVIGTSAYNHVFSGSDCESFRQGRYERPRMKGFVRRNTNSLLRSLIVCTCGYMLFSIFQKTRHFYSLETMHLQNQDLFLPVMDTSSIIQEQPTIQVRNSSSELDTPTKSSPILDDGKKRSKNYTEEEMKVMVELLALSNRGKNAQNDSKSRLELSRKKQQSIYLGVPNSTVKLGKQGRIYARKIHANDTKDHSRHKRNEKTRKYQNIKWKEAFKPTKASCLLGSRVNEYLDKTMPVRVRVISFLHPKRDISFRDDNITWAISDEVLNICMDGMKRSAYFDLLEPVIVPFNMGFNDTDSFYIPEDEDVIWMVDMRRYVPSKSKKELGESSTLNNPDYISTMDQLATLVNRTLRYQEHERSRRNNTRLWNGDKRSDTNHFGQTHQNWLPSIKIVLMDWRDRVGASICHDEGIYKVKQLLGANNVRQVAQQIVWKRHWDPSQNFPDPGRILPPQLHHCFNPQFSLAQDYATTSSETLHMPYTVRSDYADEIEKVYGKTRDIMEGSTSSTLFSPDSDRPFDVAHFWDIHENEASAHLRNAVTELIKSIAINTTKTSETEIKIIGHSVSSMGNDGRINYQQAYLDALLKTKIVIVAQRDGWEDHYRFFEAIVGGALVMTDPMLTLPSGYEHGKNIIIYQSLDHLHNLILYYLDTTHQEERLSISRKGWLLAMTQHRSQHWMERLFFGEFLDVS